VSSGETGGDGYRAGYTDVLDWRCRREGVLVSSSDGSKAAVTVIPVEDDNVHS